MVGAWSKQQIIEVLSVRIVVLALKGRPSPIAARVLNKLEGT
jgi:hypothetical protein